MGTIEIHFQLGFGLCISEWDFLPRIFFKGKELSKRDLTSPCIVQAFSSKFAFSISSIVDRSFTSSFSWVERLCFFNNRRKIYVRWKKHTRYWNDLKLIDHLLRHLHKIYNWKDKEYSTWLSSLSSLMSSSIPRRSDRSDDLTFFFRPVPFFEPKKSSYLCIMRKKWANWKCVNVEVTKFKTSLTYIMWLTFQIEGWKLKNSQRELSQDTCMCVLY